MSERIWLDNVRITAEEKPTGIDELATKQQINVVQGGLSINGYEGQQVRVFSVDGRQVNAFVANDHSTISVSPGIYIVTVGKQAFKICVR